MNLIKIQKELGNIFSLNDLAKLTGKNKKYLSVYLNNHLKKGNIHLLRKGWYYFEEFNKFLISKTFPGTYISLTSALEYYGFSTQRYINLELCSLNQKKSQKILDWRVDFIKIKKVNFFGYKKEMISGQEILIADKEKLLIDCLLNQQIIVLEETNEYLTAVLNELNIEKLNEYLRKINSYALNKRIGYLLEKQGIKLKLKINNKYDYLDLNKSKKNAVKNKKWKLLQND
ncbi:MAG: type IV toxin-antitoxin system AbiEi family antitoxin domain-containing protein [Candidatus Woesearchaeota archaeon]